MGEKRKNKIQRVAVDCVFRPRGYSRKFITPANFEAFNMLMHKLDRRGVKDKIGKLVFEFDPSYPNFSSWEYGLRVSAERGQLLVLKPKRRRSNG